MKRWDREPLTPEEIDAVIAAGKDEEGVMIMLSVIDLGIRENELVRMTRGWFQWARLAHGLVRIPVRTDYQPVPGTKGRGPKTKKPRNVPLSARLREAMQTWLKSDLRKHTLELRRSIDPEVNSDMVMYRSATHIYNVCVAAGEAAGLYTSRKLPEGGKEFTVCEGVEHSPGWHFCPHIGRHTFITAAWYNTELKDAEIGQLVGHKDGGMVRNSYLHIDEDETLRKMGESGWLER